MLAITFLLLQGILGLRGQLNIRATSQEDLHPHVNSSGPLEYPDYVMAAYYAATEYQLSGSSVMGYDMTPRPARYAASDASGRVELILEGSVQLPRYVSQVELAFRLHPDYLNSTEQDDLGDSPLDPVRVCDLDNHSCQKATAARRCVALTDIHGTWDTFDVSFLSSVSGGPLRLQVELPGFNQQQPCYYLNTSEGPVLAIWKLPEQAHSVAEFFQVAHLQHLSRRNKRHLPPLPPPGRNEGQDTCRRVPWEVHFDADLGWDWVVRPKTYEASTCVGSCPIGLNGTVAISNHALLRIETKRLGLDTDLSLADACCVPTKMRSKVIWMYNRRGDYVVRSVDNMAVEECGCL